MLNVLEKQYVCARYKGTKEKGSQEC